MPNPPPIPAKTPPLKTPPAARPRPGGPALPPGPGRPESPAGRARPAAFGPESARPYAALALARIAEMIDDPDPKVALSASREILDRAWGRARAAKTSEGLQVVVRIREAGDA